MATSAKESNHSLLRTIQLLNLNLIELKDWNCCGSSSAHSLDRKLASNLAARNLSLAPRGKPLMIMCPSCLHRLSLAQFHLKQNPELHAGFESRWGPIDKNMEILHFFDILDRIGLPALKKASTQNLNKLKIIPYYGCMLAKPPVLRHEKKHYGLIETLMSALGAESKNWAFASRCCGTFLAAARPDIVTPLVNEIMSGAVKSGADCIVTACAMCQLNLEIRCTLEYNIPILHFSEILAIALGEKECKGWFSRHLVDPRPLLKNKNLID